MNTLKKIVKIVFYTIITLIVFVFGTDVFSIPNYKSNDAIFQYSEDKKHKGILVSTYEKSKNPIAILVRTSDNEILAYSQLTKNSKIKTHWFSNSCSNNDAVINPCFKPASFMEPLPLSPTLWQRINAWLTVKIRGFEIPMVSEYNFKT